MDRAAVGMITLARLSRYSLVKDRLAQRHASQTVAGSSLASRRVVVTCRGDRGNINRTPETVNTSRWRKQTNGNNATITEMVSLLSKLTSCLIGWGSGNRRTPDARSLWDGVGGSEESAGNDLLSRCKHYHRPQVLIGRVRDGNGSFHLGEITGKLPEYQ